MIPVSSVPGFMFPAMPNAYAGVVSHILWQLNNCERMPPERMQVLQFAQLTALLLHAFNHSPFWRQRLERAGWSPEKRADPSLLERLPPLTRADVQDNFDSLRAGPLPESYGPIFVSETSGSTGRAVRVEKSRIQSVIYDAITMRDHQWHGRDFLHKISTIRPKVESRALPNWGMPVAALFRTGPASVLDSATPDFEAQFDWLLAEKPHYLMTTSTRIQDLAEIALGRKTRVDNLRQVMTYAGVISPEVRDLVREAFGVEIADQYSAEEVGQIACQCPKHHWYHVQREAVIVELVGEDGRPVPVGQPGHVLVTVLHSFAMPLIRYEVGDMAVAGPPCDCGRTLPVLATILGRDVAVLKLPNGQRRRVVLLARDFLKHAPIRDFRVVMYANEEVDIFVTANTPIDDAAREGIVRTVQEKLGHSFPAQVRQVAQIDWGKSWKREPFVRAAGLRPQGAATESEGPALRGPAAG